MVVPGMGQMAPVDNIAAEQEPWVLCRGRSLDLIPLTFEGNRLAGPLSSHFRDSWLQPQKRKRHTTIIIDFKKQPIFKYKTDALTLAHANPSLYNSSHH